MKELNINGKIFAKYETENSRIYLKNYIYIFPENKSLSEDIAINIIQVLENTHFTEAAYLNIP